MSLQKVILAAPRGPCAGVERALALVERALEESNPPIYVNHEIVHNSFVVEDLKKRGVRFEEDLRRIPEGATYLFSAHGVAPGFREETRKKKLHIIDATCPLVDAVHQRIARTEGSETPLFYIGHEGHQEAKGVLGITPMTLITSKEDAEAICARMDPQQEVSVFTQTTLSLQETGAILEIFQRHFAKVHGGKNICYATTNRQEAVRALCKNVDALIILGSQNSSNARRLLETGKSFGIPALLLERASALPSSFLEDKRVLGVSSGASVPEELVTELLERLQGQYPKLSQEILETKKEELRFPL